MNEQFIKLPTAKGEVLVKPEEIICISSCDKTVNVYLDNGTTIEALTAIGKMDKLVEYGYSFKCHRCHVVNLYKIKQIINGYSSIILNNGEEVSISRNRKKGFKNALDKVCKKWGG